MKKVIVIAPHPDDETLGCGGTILKHRLQGDDVHWLIVTNISDEKGWPAAKVRARQEEIKKVGRMYGFKEIHKLDFPTTELDQIPMNDLVAVMSKVVSVVKPQIVYLPNRSDVHTDHQVIFKAAMGCTKNFRYPFIERILMYEVPSETEFAPALSESVFIPNVFMDITPFIEKKLKIMSIYQSEVMKPPLPRSLATIKALAQWRGSHISKPYAEAFTLLKEIN